MTIEYKAKKSLSQSMLKSMLKGVRAFKQKVPTGPAIRKGNMVDCLITEPDKFDERYKSIHIPEVSSTKSREMVERYYEYGQSNNFEDKDFFNADNIIYFCQDIYKHYVKYKKTTLIDTLKANGSIMFLKYLIDKDDEIEYVDESEVELAKLIVQSLKMSKYTGFYVKADHEYEDYYDIYNQEPIYFEYSYISKSDKNYELPSKALVDRIIVNHQDKTITPIDIKTTNTSTGVFTRKIQEFRYDIQAYWYTYAIDNQWKFDKDLDDYEVLDFLFVVENSGEYIGRPLIYKLSEQDMKVAQKGIINGMPGAEDAIELYLWHSLNDIWNEDKIVIENKGIIETKINAKQILP